MSQITGLLPTLARADNLKSVEALKQAVNDGTIPGYIGVPMIADLVKKQQQAQGMAQSQPTQTVEDQVYAQAAQLQNPQPQMPQQQMPQQQMPQQMPQQIAQQPPVQPAGITGAQSNLPTRTMAGGGIVAFAGNTDGSLVDDDTDPQDDDTNEEYYADIDSKNQIAKMIARQAESSALTDALMQQQGSGYGINPETQNGSGIRPDAKGITGINFTDKLEHLESRGRDYDEKGNILTSSKGAMGRMQTMPATLRDPGFGVKPAQNNSVDEMNRVGRDFGNAMLRRYGNEKDAAMAYNWGPGNVDKWIAGGRKGPVPGETRQYASNFKQGGIVQLAGGGAVAFAGNTDGSLVSDEPESAIGAYFKGTPEQQDFAKKYLEESRKKAEVEKALTAPELDLPFYKAVRPSERAAVETKRNELYKQLPSVQPAPIAPATTGLTEEEMRIGSGRPEMSGLPSGGQTAPAPTLAPAGIDALTTPQASAEEDLFKQMQKSYAEKEASHKSEKTMDNYLALLQGFLGMMGGTSPYAMANIGLGGTAGISYLANARKQQGLTERGLGREQLGLFTAKQAMDKSAEDRELRKKLGLGGLEERYGKDVTAVEGRRIAEINKLIKADMDLTYRLPAIEKKIGDAAILGKPPEPEVIAEYNRLKKKQTDIESKIKNSMPLPPRPGALGSNTSGVIKLD
jgi:hypothetical protein